MTKSFACLIASAVAVGAVPASAAGTQMETLLGTVAVGDVDFADPGDMARFERRVRQQARMLCGVGGRVGLTEQLAEQECVSSFEASAQRQVPQLVAAARAKSAPRLASIDL